MSLLLFSQYTTNQTIIKMRAFLTTSLINDVTDKLNFPCVNDDKMGGELLGITFAYSVKGLSNCYPCMIIKEHQMVFFAG